MRKHLVGAAALAGVALLVTGCSGASSNAASGNAAQPAPQAEAGPTDDQIRALFDDWNAALATGDPQKVADLYAPNAVLLPTLSNNVRSSRAEIVDYFEHFLKNKPQGTILEEHVAVLNAEDAVNAGTYRFALTQDGKPVSVDARYTYVYEKIGGKWLIVNHHSSAMPEKA